jgi:hypothetical protein
MVMDNASYHSVTVTLGLNIKEADSVAWLLGKLAGSKLCCVNLIIQFTLVIITVRCMNKLM